MKDWDYYQTPKAPYFGYDEKSAFKAGLLETINNSKLTASERQFALDGVNRQVREHQQEQNQLYREEARKLDLEFYADCRADLGYGDVLTEAGCNLLEAKAYEDGHASGYSEVYNFLIDLSSFAEKLILEGKS